MLNLVFSTHWPRCHWGYVNSWNEIKKRRNAWSNLNKCPLYHKTRRIISEVPKFSQQGYQESKKVWIKEQISTQKN